MQILQTIDERLSIKLKIITWVWTRIGTLLQSNTQINWQLTNEWNSRKKTFAQNIYKKKKKMLHIIHIHICTVNFMFHDYDIHSSHLHSFASDTISGYTPPLKYIYTLVLCVYIYNNIDGFIWSRSNICLCENRGTQRWKHAAVQCTNLTKWPKILIILTIDLMKFSAYFFVFSFFYQQLNSIQN